MAANRRFYEQSGYSRAGPALVTVVTRIREGRPRAQAAPLREVRSKERDVTTRGSLAAGGDPATFGLGWQRPPSKGAGGGIDVAPHRWHTK